MGGSKHQYINVSPLHAARMLAYEVLMIIGDDNHEENPLFWLPKFDSARQLLKEKCEAQMADNCTTVVLKLDDFPKVPILSTRVAAGNGYCQCSASEKLGGKRFYLHRAAAMFRIYEEKGITMVEMAAMLDREASHLLIMPLNHSKRNINPWHLCFEFSTFNMSRLFCKLLHEQETVAAAKLFNLSTPKTAHWKGKIDEYKGQVGLVYEQLVEADGKSTLTLEELSADQQISELYAEEMGYLTDLMPLKIGVNHPQSTAFTSQGSPVSPTTPVYKNITLQEFAESQVKSSCHRLHHTEEHPPCVFWDYNEWGTFTEQMKAVEKKWADKVSSIVEKAEKKAASQAEKAAAAAAAAGATAVEAGVEASAAKGNKRKGLPVGEQPPSKKS